MSLKRLTECMSVQTKSRKTERMVAFLEKKLGEMGIPYTVENGNVYATKGVAEYYPCFAAHTDTVHEIVSDMYVFNHKNKLYAINPDTLKQVGTGGDDKVGVYLALEMLRTTTNAKAVFFRDEEIGGQGSQAANMSFFIDAAYVLQADRRGVGDFINSIGYTTLMTDTCLGKIEGVLSKYKRRTVDGSFTDVKNLISKGIACSCANMSCGYYSPHCSQEYIDVQHVMSTLNMINEIVSTLGEEFQPAPKSKVRRQSLMRGPYNRPNHSDPNPNTAMSFPRLNNGHPINGCDGEPLDLFDAARKSAQNDSTRIPRKEKKENKKILSLYDGLGKTCPTCKCENVEEDEFEQLIWCHNCQAYVMTTSTSFV